MIDLKATAIGVVTGLVLAVLWVTAALWLPIYWEMALSSARHDFGGGAGSSVGSGSAMLAALVGFTAGFFWTIRRARRRLLA